MTPVILYTAEDGRSHRNQRGNCQGVLDSSRRTARTEKRWRELS